MENRTVYRIETNKPQFEALSPHPLEKAFIRATRMLYIMLMTGCSIEAAVAYVDRMEESENEQYRP